MSSGGLAGGNEFYHRTAVGAADALGAQAPRPVRPAAPARAAPGGAGAPPLAPDGRPCTTARCQAVRRRP